MADPKMLKAQMDETLQNFISACLKFDTPRLNEEEYPEGVLIEEDISFLPESEETEPMREPDSPLSSSRRILDIYTPAEDSISEEEAFLLIHGGGFGYGCKELDKCFGMHLSLSTGMDVASINYRLMPKADLYEQLEDIMQAAVFLASDRGYKRFHTIGDSAGGYLALLSAILLNSFQARADFGLSRFDKQIVDLSISAKSVSMISGHTMDAEDAFVGYYFDPAKKLPKCIYDLSEAVKSYGCPQIVQVTSDNDTLLEENREFHEKLTSLQIPLAFYCAESTPERNMHHVYPIAHPTWPESQDVIELIRTSILG